MRNQHDCSSWGFPSFHGNHLEVTNRLIGRRKNGAAVFGGYCVAVNYQVPFGVYNGNAVHAVRTQCTHSAKFCMSANTRTLLLALWGST